MYLKKHFLQTKHNKTSSQKCQKLVTKNKVLRLHNLNLNFSDFSLIQRLKRLLTLMKIINLCLNLVSKQC